jgi:fatty acid desaturase
MPAEIEPKFDAMKDFLPAQRPTGMISSEELRGLMQIRHGRVLRDILLFWGMILATLGAAVAFPYWWVWALCFVSMGCLQNALITWTHEASHCNLHRKKKINDLIANLLLCGPAGLSVDQYRWHHVSHHKYLGDSEKEVELVAWMCLRGGHLFSEIARHLFGFSALRIIRRKKRFSAPDSPIKPPPPRSTSAWIGFLAGNALLFGLCWFTGYWYLYFILWVAPLFTLALMISNFRTVVEHQASAEICDQQRAKMPALTRLIECNWLERVLIAPIGFDYHYEHHLYPSVPYHRLPELRLLLKQKGHYEQAGIVRETSYLRALWSLAMRPGYGIRLLNPFAELPNPNHP